MIKTILNNEFKKHTGQVLTEYEYTVLMDYIEYYGESDWQIDNLRVAIADFIQECYDHNECEQYADYEQPEYTIKPCKHFPMAKKQVVDGWRITTYRGCTIREVAK